MPKFDVPYPGDTIVVGTAIHQENRGMLGLVISVDRVKGLVGEPAWSMYLLTCHGIIETMLHLENYGKTWRLENVAGNTRA